MSSFEKAEEQEIEAAIKRQATPEHEQVLAEVIPLPEFGKPFAVEYIPDIVA